MSARPSELRSRLRSISPDLARLQNNVIAALNGRVIGGLRTAARIAGVRELHAVAGWILFDSRRGRIGISPLLADGALARILGDDGRPDGATAAATLAAVEPLIAATETLLGLELRPAGLAADMAEDRVMIRLDGHQAGGPIRHRLLVAFPPDFTVDPAPPPVPPLESLAALMLRWRGTIVGPRLSAQRIATVGVGDLVLLGVGPVSARICLPGRAEQLQAVIDPVAREARLISESTQGGVDVSNREDQPKPEQPDEPAPQVADIRVPIRIEFDGGTVAASELAAIAAGSVLPLPESGGTLPVRLVAGETQWADGELVAIGDGYGILIGAVTGTAD